jgi:hypothetical protein
MRILTAIICSSILLLSASVLKAQEPQPSAAPISTGAFAFSGVDFGESHPYSKIRLNVTAKNLGANLVEIDRIVPREPSSSEVKFKAGRLAPGQSATLDATVNLNESVGRVAYYFDVYAKGSTEPVDGFVIRGFVDWLISPTSTDVDLGIVDVRAPLERVVRIEARPGVNIKLVKVEKGSEYFNAEIIENGSALKLRSKTDAPWAMFDEHLLVGTDSLIQPKIGFRLRGQMRGLVVPNSDPVDFGLLREGQGAERIVRLEDVTGKELKIGKIVAHSRMSVDTVVSDCVPVSAACKYIRVVYPPMTMRGTTGGALKVEILGYEKELSIRFGAIGIGKDTQVRDLAEDMKAQQEVPKSLSSVLQSSVAKVETKKAVPTQMETPTGNGPLLKWQVANEYDIYGYEIYRGDKESGPFARVNARMQLRLQGDPEMGSVYQWRDNSAEPGKTYWYFINVVYNKGRKEQFTQPQKVVAK